MKTAGRGGSGRSVPHAWGSAYAITNSVIGDAWANLQADAGWAVLRMTIIGSRYWYALPGVRTRPRPPAAARGP